MKTERFLITSTQQPEEIQAAAAILRRGGLVALPTETVYGLAANALSAQSVAKIFMAKGRPQDNPLIVHLSALSQLAALVREVDSRVSPLAEAFWPGPLTLVLPKSGIIPDVVSAGLPSVALRIPDHAVTRAIISEAGFPLAAPSANRSGSPSPTTAQHVLEDLDGKIDAIVDGGSCAVGVESTVLSLTGKEPRLLRPGGVSLEALQQVLGAVEVDPAVCHKLDESQQAASPGMKYKHYAPKAKVLLLKGSREAYAAFLRSLPDKEGVLAMCFSEDLPLLQDMPALPRLCYGAERDAIGQARQVFAALRRADALGAKTVYVHCPQQSGLGLAVYNRLLRAAAFQVLELS